MLPVPAALVRVQTPAPSWARAVTVTIVSPAPEETLHGNPGNLPASPDIVKFTLWRASRLLPAQQP